MEGGRWEGERVWCVGFVRLQIGFEWILEVRGGEDVEGWG